MHSKIRAAAIVAVGLFCVGACRTALAFDWRCATAGLERIGTDGDLNYSLPLLQPDIGGEQLQIELVHRQERLFGRAISTWRIPQLTTFIEDFGAAFVWHAPNGRRLAFESRRDSSRLYCAGTPYLATRNGALIRIFDPAQNWKFTYVDGIAREYQTREGKTLFIDAVGAQIERLRLSEHLVAFEAKYTDSWAVSSIQIPGKRVTFDYGSTGELVALLGDVSVLAELSYVDGLVSRIGKYGQSADEVRWGGEAPNGKRILKAFNRAEYDYRDYRNWTILEYSRDSERVGLEINWYEGAWAKYRGPHKVVETGLVHRDPR